MFEIIGIIAATYLLLGVCFTGFLAFIDGDFGAGYIRDIKEAFKSNPFTALVYVFCTLCMWPIMFIALIED